MISAGIHDHSTNKHTWEEVALNFVIVLFGALSAAYTVSQGIPTVDQAYGMLINAVVTTAAMLGYNITKAYQKNKKKNPKGCGA